MTTSERNLANYTRHLISVAGSDTWERTLARGMRDDFNDAIQRAEYEPVIRLNAIGRLCYRWQRAVSE